MFFWSILLAEDLFSDYSKELSVVLGACWQCPWCWHWESLRQESSRWAGARAPGWQVPAGHKLSLTSCRRTSRGQEIRPKQVWLAYISRHSWGALQLKTTELSRWGSFRSCNYIVKSRGKPRCTHCALRQREL